MIYTLYPLSVRDIYPTPNAIQCNNVQLYNRPHLHSAYPLSPKPPSSSFFLHPISVSALLNPRQSFPLPLLMLRIQRANNINMSLPTLPSLPPNTLSIISASPPYNLLHPPHSNSSRPLRSWKHTLQPSQSFLTLLLTFIPLTCSCTPFPNTFPSTSPCTRNCGLLALPQDSAENRLELVVVAVDVWSEEVEDRIGREKDGNITRAVRNIESAGIMLKIFGLQLEG
jgi:hypothetical protein